MSKSIKALHHFAVLLTVTALITGCNIFGFASDVELSPVEKAEEAIRDGDYEKAKSELADAVADSTDEYALYLDAKATLLKAGVDIVEIVQLIEGDDAQENEKLGILNVVDDLSNEEMTAWYQANTAVASNLAILYSNEAPDIFDPEDIALDYTVSNLMSGVLGIRDTNQDGLIDDNDFILDLTFLQTDITNGYEISGGTFVDEFGNIQEFSGLEVFLGDYAGKITAAGKITGPKGYKPDDINNIIKFILHHLDNGANSLKVLFEKLNSAFEPDDIEKYIAEIASIINFYWYDDGIDNDGDGLIDEEVINGIDDDGDGLIDEDSKYHPADPSNVRNTQHHNLFYKWQERLNSINRQ